MVSGWVLLVLPTVLTHRPCRTPRPPRFLPPNFTQKLFSVPSRALGLTPRRSQAEGLLKLRVWPG